VRARVTWASATRTFRNEDYRQILAGKYDADLKRRSLKVCKHANAASAGKGWRFYVLDSRFQIPDFKAFLNIHIIPTASNQGL